MAASFIKKSNGNYYLRLTGDTDAVKFAAVSEAGNTYTFYIDGTAYVSKPYDDNGGTYYTSSANPPPAGGNLDDGRFPGTETIYSFPGSGTRDYLLSLASSGPGTFFALGGEALSWGGYAYPGDGYIANALAVGVKQSGSWKNAGNLFVKQSGSWKEVTTGWIKQGGVWKKFFQNFGNSFWINMLENTDDAIDFGVQVIALWSWPVSSFDGYSSYYPDQVISDATSDTIIAPVDQSVTLYISVNSTAGGTSTVLLRRLSDNAIIWSTSITGNAGTDIQPFNVSSGVSYQFESYVSINAGSIGLNYARVYRDNSFGTLIYSNSAEAFSD